jgi:hypothetical protein
MGNGSMLPFIGAALVFVAAEVYLFTANSGSIDWWAMGDSVLKSGFVNDIIFPGAGILIIGFIIVTKVAGKRGISLPWSK